MSETSVLLALIALIGVFVTQITSVVLAVLNRRTLQHTAEVGDATHVIVNSQRTASEALILALQGEVRRLNVPGAVATPDSAPTGSITTTPAGNYIVEQGPVKPANPTVPPLKP
jgi:hypothetical protein